LSGYYQTGFLACPTRRERARVSREWRRASRYLPRPRRGRQLYWLAAFWCLAVRLIIGAIAAAIQQK
jgi:hypothetical protein